MVNRLKRLPSEFKRVLKIASSVAVASGVKIYLVGGVVRDLILDRCVFDLDIVVEGDAIAFAHKLSKRINGEFMRHHVFGTATVSLGKHKIDFTTARTEHYPHSGSLPKVKPASLVEDLIRRDFSINALAIGLNKGDYGQLIDLYTGHRDLKLKTIRVLHDKSFWDDPTRILRAIRFEQRFRGFKIERQTLSLMKQAIAGGALNLVNPHRLRDELILLLKEPQPYRYIKRVSYLEGFNFIDPKIKLDKRSFTLFSKIEKAVPKYKKIYKQHRDLELWLLYLAAILIRLSPNRINSILSDFAFKKGERIIVNSVKAGINKIKQLDKKLKKRTIYKILNPYSFEAIFFFYAYYRNQKLRTNIEYFWRDLVNIRLKVKGRDFKKIGFKPYNAYNRVLKELLYLKMDKGLSSKKEELNAAKEVFKKLSA